MALERVFLHKTLKMNFYKEIEPIISKFEQGEIVFLKLLIMVFQKRLDSAKDLQKYYELQVSNCSVFEPTELVEEVTHISQSNGI